MSFKCNIYICVMYKSMFMFLNGGMHIHGIVSLAIFYQKYHFRNVSTWSEIKVCMA